MSTRDVRLSTHTVQASRRPFSQNPVALRLPSRYSSAADSLRGKLHQLVLNCRHLHCFLSRLFRRSRDETPDGSLLAFAWVILRIGSTPIHLITRQHSLAPSSLTRRPVGAPRGLLSPVGGRRAYHVPCVSQSRLGFAKTPVGHHLRADISQARSLPTDHVGPSLSASWACLSSRR